jgi:hypothetical protein
LLKKENGISQKSNSKKKFEMMDGLFRAAQEGTENKG